MEDSMHTRTHTHARTHTHTHTHTHAHTHTRARAHQSHGTKMSTCLMYGLDFHLPGFLQMWDHNVVHDRDDEHDHSVINARHQVCRG